MLFCLCPGACILGLKMTHIVLLIPAPKLCGFAGFSLSYLMVN